jgi:uncharacterized protein (DUF2345 family)
VAAAGAVGDGELVEKSLGSTSDPKDFGGTNVPGDMVEGEFAIANALGTGVDFLLNIIRLRSGRAFVEACLLDDSVRLVSKNFTQHHAGGDTLVRDDGRIDLYESFTSYQHEAWGQLSPDAAKVRVGAGLIDAPTDEELTQTGRYRMETFKGFLGDFFHQWITEPEAVLGSLATQGTRSATSRHWAGSDGSLLWQSLGEIAFERVVAIPVPCRAPGKEGLTKPEYGQEYYKNLESSFLKIWDKGLDQYNPHQSAFQIRQYSRWLSQYLSFARFHQQQDRWDVPSEVEVGTPDRTSGEKDKEDANGGAIASYTAYSTLRLMRDGSILALESGGACMLLSGGRAWISAPLDLNFEAGGDIYFTAGRDIWMKARRTISITAVFGALSLKARASLRALCERGSLWLKSDALKSFSDDEGTADNPKAEYAGAAVRIEASRGTAVLTAATQAVITSQGSGEVDADDESSPGGLILEAAKGQVLVRSRRDTKLDAGANVYVKAGAQFLVVAQLCLMDLRSCMLQIINAAVIYRGGLITSGSIAARSVSASAGFSGPSDKVGKNPDIPTPNPPWMDPPTPPSPDGFSRDVTTDELWKFPVPTASPDQPVMETLSQQFLRTETPPTNGPEWPTMASWNQAQDKLAAAPGTDDGSCPYPLADWTQLESQAGESLHLPSATKPNEMPEPEDLIPNSITTKYVQSA